MTDISKEIEFIKDILDDHKADIESIKRKLIFVTQKIDELTNKIIYYQNQETKTQQQEISTKKENTEINLLKNQMQNISKNISQIKETIGNNRNFQFPIPISNSQKSSKIISSHQIIPHPNTFEQSLQQNMNLEKFQILFILKQSKALSPQLAVSAKQLKDAFSIDKTVRTIHNKLDSLCREGFTIRIGKKPTLYFLSQEGLNAISKQERNVFSFTPQEY